MTEHSVPAGRLCPFISTAQVLISEIAFQAQAQKGMSLAGIQGASMAASPDVTTGKAVVIHKDPALPEGFDPAAGKPLDIAQVKTFTAQPISVPCVRAKCQKWCDKHEAAACGSGCNQCQAEIMTQAFTAGLEAQGQSLGLASARKLLDKAHESLEPQENSA